MAHGTPKLSICENCNQYTYTSRFSEYPKCLKCNEVSKHTTKDFLIKNYLIGLFRFVYPNFEQWIELLEKR